MNGPAASMRGGIAHVFLAVALCLPLVVAAFLIGVSMAASRASVLSLVLLTAVAIAFLAMVVWASLLPAVRQVEVSAARALLEYDEVRLPDVRFPRAWSSRRRGAAWLAVLAAVGAVVAAAIVYLVPFGIGLLFFPASGESTVTWPVIARATDVGAGWDAVWLTGIGLLALAGCLAIVVMAARLLISLAPRLLGPTVVERIDIAADRERALARANAVARDLHDQLGHTLTAMTVQATAAHRLMATDPQAAERALTAVEDLGRRAQADVDDVVRMLRGDPAVGRSTSTSPDLVEIARTLAHDSPLEVELHVPETLPVADVWSDTARAVIREALTNATRHGAGSAAIRLQADGHSVRIEVRNPVDHPITTPPRRAGLAGLHERVLLADGELTAGPDGGDSWVLVARLPTGRPAATR